MASLSADDADTGRFPGGLRTTAPVVLVLRMQAGQARALAASVDV